MTYNIPWELYINLSYSLSRIIKNNKKQYKGIFGIPNSANILATILSYDLDLPLISESKVKLHKNLLLVANINDDKIYNFMKYGSFIDIGVLFFKPENEKVKYFVNILPKNTNLIIRYPYEKSM